MDEEACRFARKMIEPMLRAFRQEVSEQRNGGASEADIEAMLARIESLNRISMDVDQLACERAEAAGNDEHADEDDPLCDGAGELAGYLTVHGGKPFRDDRHRHQGFAGSDPDYLRNSSVMPTKVTRRGIQRTPRRADL